MKKPHKKCRYCDADISKDGVGLNKKLFELDTKKALFVCLPCMALSLDCSIEDLVAKIETFKAEGCEMFS